MKQVRIQRFDREPLAGHIDPRTYLRANGIEILSPSGAHSVVPYEEIKVLYFVGDFRGGETRVERRTFSSRPKLAGLWVRLHFRDGDLLEGVLPNDFLALDTHGFTITPPDWSIHHRKVFVPRAALTRAEVLGVVGSAASRPRRKPLPDQQIGLFES